MERKMKWAVTGCSDIGGQFTNLKEAKACAKEASEYEPDAYVLIWKLDDWCNYFEYHNGKCTRDGWTIKKPAKMIKWSIWSPCGMHRHGQDTLKNIMYYMKGYGKEAKKRLADSGKDHAVYGRKMIDSKGNIAEVRIYLNTFMDDDELDKVSRECPHDLFYVVHKH